MNTKINTLSRNEMKSITAGDMPGGNIYCNIGGTQTQIFACMDLSDCVDVCTIAAELQGSYCGGCAQFPIP